MNNYKITVSSLGYEDFNLLVAASTIGVAGTFIREAVSNWLALNDLDEESRELVRVSRMTRKTTDLQSP